MVEQNQSNVTQNPETTAFQLTVKKWNHCLVSPAETKFEIGSVYFLSNIDDDLTILRTIYCFKSDSRGNDAAGDVIKDALSKVLVHYYPLAGRVTVTPEGKFAVKCTGEGVVFVEAEANCALKDVDFSRPDKVTRAKLVVNEVPGVENKFDIPLAVQVTKFECGGFTLGISFNHLLADGQSAVEFIISWAEIARGISPISNPPFLDRTILKARIPLQIPFHHPEFDSIEHKSADINPFLNQPNVSEYIHFTPQMIQTLKSRAAAESLENRAPSTYEALSAFVALTAFVWRARTIALKMAHDQLTRVIVVVNARDKFEPPLPKGYFGNAIKFMPVTCMARELVNEPLSYAVGLIQDAIDRVDDGLLRSTIDYYELTKADRSLGFTCISSAWGGLAFGSTNLGWGEPVATGPVELPVDEGMLFLREYESMYVYIWLPVSAMNTFQELVQQI
ncbi:Omega-hydroxypalmitate O-feruloyl transferase [Linum perenne]